jgi:hypothetical protein
VGRGAGEELEGGAGEGVLVGAPVDVVAVGCSGAAWETGPDGEVRRCAVNTPLPL